MHRYMYAKNRGGIRTLPDLALASKYDDRYVACNKIYVFNVMYNVIKQHEYNVVMGTNQDSV